MTILDRYITKSIVKTFIGCLVVFSFLYVLIDTAANLDELLDRKVPFGIIVQYYLWFLPVILVQTAAMGCLISTTLTYSGLNHHNEIIVLRSSGMHFWQIAKPALAFACIIAAVIFTVNEKFVPQSEIMTKKIRNENMIIEGDARRKKHAKIKNLTFYGLRNRLYFIDSYDPNDTELSGITIIEYNQDQNIDKKIVALRGSWTGLAWNFENVQVTEFSYDIQTPTKVRVYKEKLMDIKETPNDFLRQRLNVSHMNINQLSEYISRFEDSGAHKALNNLLVDLHAKIAFPFGVIAIILVGLPFTLMTGRRKAVTFTALGFAVLIGFFYYVANAVGLALGKGGLFPPAVAAWLAPGSFTLLAVYFIRTKF